VYWVEPRTWKGQIPKDIHHARIYASLSSVEQATVDRGLKGVRPKLREDAMDAIGIGLYARKAGLFTF
jgi:hypothetical protein